MFQKKQTDKENIVGKKSVSVVTVFSILGLLFATLCFSMFFFRYSSLSPLARFYSKPIPTFSISDTLMTEAAKTPSKVVEVKITADQLSTAVCVACDSFPLRKGTLSVNPGGISVSGKTSGLFGLDVDILLKPKVEAGQLKFDIADMKTAGVPAPQKLKDALTPQLNNLFSQVLPSSNAVYLTDVNSMVGYLLLEGTKK